MLIYVISTQAVPAELKDKSTGQVIEELLFSSNVGPLVAAMVSTYGIYLVSSILYVGIIFAFAPYGTHIDLTSRSARPVAHVYELRSIFAYGAQFYQRSERVRVLQPSRCALRLRSWQFDLTWLITCVLFCSGLVGHEG